MLLRAPGSGAFPGKCAWYLVERSGTGCAVPTVGRVERRIASGGSAARPRNAQAVGRNAADSPRKFGNDRVIYASIERSGAYPGASARLGQRLRCVGPAAVDRRHAAELTCLLRRGSGAPRPSVPRKLLHPGPATPASSTGRLVHEKVLSSLLMLVAVRGCG
jgi:hypothetical protein